MNDPLAALDNPAWHALNSVHRPLSAGTETAKRYLPNIVSFAACADASAASAASLDTLIRPGESFFIIGALPPLPAGWAVQNELVCLQMVCASPAAALPDAPVIQPLGEAEKEEMHALITSVQPGYYLPDTHRMGAYFGIRQEGRLVAMAGERMRLAGLTELSAICTVPAFTGRKYAQHLITHLVNRHLLAGVTSFLHVAQSNERAVRLYEHLGFVTRRHISFWLLRKNG